MQEHIQTRAANNPVQENPWRAPAPILVEGKYGSVMVDRGVLTKAVAASNNHYLFSDTPVGAQSLVIVGTPLQVMDFLLTHQQRGVESKLMGQQEIYVGISPYKPESQFSGVFPANDLLASIAGFLSNFIPTPDWSALIGIPDQLESLNGAIDSLSSSDKAKGDVLYVKFSYLPEDKMIQVGNGKVSFKEVLHVFQKHYKKS